jgi:transposase
MTRFVEGQDRGQSALFPECLEDWIDENNPVRVIDVLVDGLDLPDLGFADVELYFRAVSPSPSRRS